MRIRFGTMLLALPAIFLLSGCAALFATKNPPVAMQTNPSGAEVWIDGNKMGVTPLTLELSTKKSYVIMFKKEGQEATATISNSVGAGWIILDVLGGLVPIIIDAATGSWYGLSTHTVNVNLAPASPASK